MPQPTTTLDRVRQEAQTQRNRAEAHATAAETAADARTLSEHQALGQLHENFHGWLQGIIINAPHAVGAEQRLARQLTSLSGLMAESIEGIDPASPNAHARTALLASFRESLARIITEAGAHPTAPAGEQV